MKERDPLSTRTRKPKGSLIYKDLGILRARMRQEVALLRMISKATLVSD